MDFIQSISVAWHKKAGNPCLCPARRQGSCTCWKRNSQPGRHQRGGIGTLKYRGDAGGAATGAGKCHSDDLPLPHARTCRMLSGRRISGGGGGRAEMVRGDWVKPGAVVIDVGINRVEDATRPRGYRLVGDVYFDEVTGCRRHHPCSRWCWPDDDCHAAAQHTAGRQTCMTNS